MFDMITDTMLCRAENPTGTPVPDNRHLLPFQRHRPIKLGRMHNPPFKLVLPFKSRNLGPVQNTVSIDHHVRVVLDRPFFGGNVEFPGFAVFGPGHRGDFGVVGGEDFDVVFFDHAFEVCGWERSEAGETG